MIALKRKRNHSARGAKAPSAQARPDEASRRSAAEQGGGLSRFTPCPLQGAGEGVGGESLNLSKGVISGRKERDDNRPNENFFTVQDNAERGRRRRRSRLFHRMTSGLKWHRDKHLRHMVLTSSPLSNEEELNKHKKALVKRIERLTIKKLIKKGYLEESKVKHYYGKKEWNEPLEFIYFSVRTGEGVSGVWHIAWFGDFIPHKWLSEQWDELHQAKNVSLVDHGKIRSSHKLVGYFLSHYFKGQDKIKHISWSWKWLKKGSVGKWKKMVKNEGIVKAIFIWDFMMKNQMENPPPGQVTLDGNMAEYPYWVRGFMQKNKEFRV